MAYKLFIIPSYTFSKRKIRRLILLDRAYYEFTYYSLFSN